MAWDFSKWLDVFLQEKGIDMEERFKVDGETGLNILSYGTVARALKREEPAEQERLYKLFVKVDFLNGNIRGCLEFLALALT